MRDEEIEIKVYGRVQGVNFRSMVRQEALSLAIKGCVFNRYDGNVEIVAQGKHKDLTSFLLWIQSSPGFSKVQGLQYQWRKPSREFLTFEIVRENSFFIDHTKSFFNLGRFFLGPRLKTVPAHVALIPDGNRRWARNRRLAPQFGHYTSASFQHLDELFGEAQTLGVKYLTLWGFSTENWKRDKKEIDAIFDLLTKNIEQFREEAHLRKIRFRHLGRKDRLPAELLKILNSLEEETKDYHEFNVQLCLDYGGNDELIRAVNKMLKNKIKKIDEKSFEYYLDSFGIPNVDLIIRTSGEQRLSGFMPFQSAYAELYFSEVHFPDFTAKEFRKAIEDFSGRQRRFGGDVKK